MQYRRMDINHATNITTKFIGTSQFSAAKILLRDVNDPATRAWIISLYRAANETLTEAQIEELPWPDVVKAVEQQILDGLMNDTAPEDVLLLLFGGNHSTWALQMMYEEGTITNASHLQRHVPAFLSREIPDLFLTGFFHRDALLYFESELHPYQALKLGSFENSGMEKTGYRQTAFSQNLETAREHYVALREEHGEFSTKQGAPKKDHVDPYNLFLDTVLLTIYDGASMSPEERAATKRTIKEGYLVSVSFYVMLQ
jgi:hypothetical protein